MCPTSAIGSGHRKKVLLTIQPVLEFHVAQVFSFVYPSLWLITPFPLLSCFYSINH